MEENQPIHLSTFSSGANTAGDKELIGAKEGSGEYIIGRNQRSVSTKGNTGSSEKINGEQLKYIRNVPGSYECIGTTVVNENIVEVYASSTPGLAPFIRVNGIVTLKSLLFPVTYNHPLQLDKNEDEQGGEIFMTDNAVDPMIFNVKNMVDSLTTDPTKYFSAFDPKLYSVNLYIPMDMPVFVAAG